MRTRHAFVALIGTLLLRDSAWAQPRDPSPPAAQSSNAEAIAKERARALVAEGIQKLDQGIYLDALDLFQKAYAAFPSPKLHFNIAQTYYELGRPLEALHHYELFVRDVPEKEMPDKWLLANQRVFQLQGRIASVAVQASVSGATVTADGAAVGATPLPAPLRFLPGPHVLIVSKPGYEQQVIEIKLEAEQAVTKRVQLITQAEAMAQRQEFKKAEALRRAAEERLRRERQEAVRRRTKTRRILRTSGWVALGAGTLGAVAAGTFGGLNLYESSKVEDGPRDWLWRGDARPHYQRAETYRTLFYGATAVGVIGLGTGVGLLLYAGREETAEPRPSPATTMFVPMLGPTGTGFAVTGRF